MIILETRYLSLYSNAFFIAVQITETEKVVMFYLVVRCQCITPRVNVSSINCWLKYHLTYLVLMESAINPDTS